MKMNARKPVIATVALVIGTIAASLAYVASPAAKPDSTPNLAAQDRPSYYLPATIELRPAPNEAPLYEYY